MEKTKNEKFILFDFDGVIVDTFNLCLEINRKLHDEPLSEEEYRVQFEGNIFDYLKTINKGAKKKGVNFFDYYNPELMNLEPVPEMVDVIISLADSYRLVVISSTINSPIQAYLKKYNLLQYFDKVFGADVHKSKVEKIKMVFNEYNLQPSDCIFITDTLGDMREAAKMNVQSIGVTWGYHRNDRLEQGNPITIVGTPKELMSQINSYFGR